MNAVFGFRIVREKFAFMMWEFEGKDGQDGVKRQENENGKEKARRRLKDQTAVAGYTGESM